MFPDSGQGQLRPGTTGHALRGIKKGDIGLNTLNGNGTNLRAVSAGFVGNPKLARYEDLTIRLK
jgi:hypothetical protein